MTSPHDPSAPQARKISNPTSGRAGAAIALAIWIGAIMLFEAEDFAPIPHSVLVIVTLFGGGWIGWQAATRFARRAHEKRLAEDPDYRASWDGE